MRSFVLVHGFSGEAGSQPYGSLPRLLASLPGCSVHQIYVSRYLSLQDGATVEDLTQAFDRALKQHNLHGTEICVIAHSLGALIVRNWVRRFSNDASAPITTAIYLTPAVFGSGWAHIGRSLMAKWLRFGASGSGDRGLGCLEALELGSEWTTRLHLDLLESPFRLKEHVIAAGSIPQSHNAIPIGYARESESDGVVRLSAANLNFQRLQLARSPGRTDYSVQIYQEPDFTYPCTGFYVFREASHSGRQSGILQSRHAAVRVAKIVEALAGNAQPAASPPMKFNFSQLVFRLRDQFGAPACDYSIHFSGGGLRFTDKHVNRKDPQNIVFYVQSSTTDDSRCTLEIEAEPPYGSSHIRYAPLKLEIPPQLRRRYIRPGMTTVIDVELQRESDQGLFTLKSA